jgi:hypothetical protein
MSKTQRATFFFISVILFSGACRGPDEDAKRLRFGFLEDARYQGQAEIAIYQGRIQRYGQMRDAELTLITVTEPVNPDERVKSEGRGPAVAGLKQNQLLTFQTGVYPYRYMNTLLWNQSTGRLFKVSMTSQDWCGQTAKTFLPTGGAGRMDFSSYWEGEGQGSLVVTIPPETGLSRSILYDELPLIVRSAEAENFRELQMFPLLMSSQVYRPDWDIGGSRRTPRFEPASWSVESVRAALPANRDAWKITVRHGPDKALADEFLVEKSPNRTLLSWKRYDGGELVLKRHTFADYWKRNKPGDALF